MDHKEREVITLNNRLKGVPQIEDFKLETKPLNPIGSTEVLIKSLYLAMDPYILFAMKAMKAGDKPTCLGLYEVIQVGPEVNNVKKGDYVITKKFQTLSWSNIQTVEGRILETVEIPENIKPESYLSLLGMTAMTAWFALVVKADIVKRKEKAEKQGRKLNVFVSGAAGAVGSLVGQICKNIFGCRVGGTAGTNKKIQNMKKNCGYDFGLNYKNYLESKLLVADLKKEFPDGIDIFFDNTGGLVNDAAFDVLAKGATAIICGQISNYNRIPPNKPEFLHKIIYTSVKIQGILILTEMTEQHRQKFYKVMSQWVAQDKIHVNDTIIAGFHNTPKAFNGLFTGKNTGKMIVKCDYNKSDFVKTRTWKHASQITGKPTLDNFKMVNELVDPLLPGQALVKAKYFSVDPYLRGRWRTATIDSACDSFGIYEIVKIAESNESDSKEEKKSQFKVGDNIFGSRVHGKWSEFQNVNLKDMKLAQKLSENMKYYEYLSVYGLVGMTAYYGLLDIGRLQDKIKAKSESKTEQKQDNSLNVFISGAAGATGSIVAQISKKVFNCHTVGTAGSVEKVNILKNKFGLDEGLNYKDYKTVDEMRAALKKAFPNGIDLYFDNTGGIITEAVWPLLNYNGTIVVCGQIAMYNNTEVAKRNDPMHHFTAKCLTVEGFVVFDIGPDFIGRFFKDMPKWVAQSKVIQDHTISEGFDKIPEAFIGLFDGKNIGKMLVKI